MDETFPNAKSGSSEERKELRRAISHRGLIGLANDTKWDEFVTAIRARTEWRPSFRYKCVDGTSSTWDVEWHYHLPFPLLSVEWLDIAHLQEVREHRLPVKIRLIDHSDWIEELLRQVGLDYRKSASMFRIFGYSPRSSELFDQ